MPIMRKTASVFALITGFSHVFCCGLPAVMALLGLGSMVGLLPAQGSDFAWFHRHEVTIFVAAGALLMLAGILQFISWRMDCRTQAGCSHPPCAPKKSLSFKIFIASALFYAINLAIYLIFDSHI